MLSRMIRSTTSVRPDAGEDCFWPRAGVVGFVRAVLELG
jgi:hypothetical protein